MSSSKISTWEGLGQLPDEAFQRLLLRSPLLTANRANSPIRQFCRSTRQFLNVDGAYLWRFSPPDDLVGADADGLMAELFGGTRLRASDNDVLNDAIRQRRTVYVNRLPSRFKLASQFQARALMASPLVVADRVVGAAAFLHMSDPDFFNDELAAKATSLTVQLGSLLERSAIPELAEATGESEQAPAENADTVSTSAALLQGIAARLRALLRTRLVCVFSDNKTGFSLQAISAESQSMAASVRSRHDRRSLQFAADLASRAIAAGEAITVSIDPSTYALGDMVPAGLLIAASFRTPHCQGAVLVYPRQEGPFTAAETGLVEALTDSLEAALTHHELCARADANAREGKDLLDIVSELNGVGELDLYLQRFSVRAAEFLGFQRCCVGLLEDGSFHLRWQAEAHRAIALDLFFPPHGPVSRTLFNQEVFWTDDFASIAGTDLRRIGEADLHQILAVPLVAGGKILGMFALLDRKDRGKISPEDIRRAELLGPHTASALEKFWLFNRMDHANRHWVEIFDAIGDFIVVHDQANKVLRINRSLADFIGVPPPSLIGVEMGALFGVENPALVRNCPFCPEDQIAPSGQVHSILEHTYLVSSSQVLAANREAQIIHVLKDVTDTREAERRYRELFSNIQEGLFFSTPEGHFVEVNDALVRMLGYASREQLLLADISGQVFSSRECYQAFAEQMQQHGGVKNYEETLRRKDGSPVYVLINGFAVRDHQGRIAQYRGLILDVSGLKTFQTELQRERDFSGKILNNTQSLILVADTAGLISYANRRWFDMGYEQRHMLGLPLQELVATARRPQLNEALAATLEGHQVDNLELQILRGDGTVGQFSVNLSPMRDEQGAVNSVVVVMTDVSDAASLQAKLMHAEKMAAVGQLVSGVAHEVNNPLTAILGFADLLMESDEVSDRVRQDLRVILQEAQRTKQIVQNLLSFARQMPPQRVPVQLNSILRRTVQLRAYDFTSHGVAVVDQFDEGLPDVIGDAQQLQQVFLNILNNAYDAVRETGRPARIEIMTTRSGKLVEVAFRDNGPGISHPDKIFDPFFTTKEVGKGTGLGLSICYGIVHQHGGEILCHNNVGSPGATFIVRLPSAGEGALSGPAGADES